MKERPILFSAPMVRAILDGSKTQTRRAFSQKKLNYFHPAIVMGEVSDFIGNWKLGPNDLGYILEACPYGQIGDRLWVRETWGNVSFCSEEEWYPDRPATKIHELKFGCGYYSGHIIYRADGEFEWCNEYGDEQSCWHPSIHMPREASRITLEITNIRVERLNDISEKDAKAEGAADYEEGIDSPPPDDGDYSWSYVASFRKLWNSINGDGSWAINPWVWCITFRRIEP